MFTLIKHALSGVAQNKEKREVQMKTFGINGFGRIGRTTFRVWWLHHRDSLDLKVINTSGSMELADWAHLLKYDSNYGVFSQDIQVNQTQSKKDVTTENPVLGDIMIGDRKIIVTAQRDPSLIPWGQFGVETVVESTGVFTTADKASGHINAGARKVIISAPTKGDGISTSVLGVMSAPQDATIISNASCTTNCVSPIAQVITSTFGIEKAMMTTVHAYTDDQNLHDNSHKDLRRARAAATNIVPTSTGAAKATALVVEF